ISTPGGVAGYAAGIYYVRREGGSIGAATTITAADQLLDLAFFALALPVAGMTLLSPELPAAITMLAFGASALMIALGAAILLARRKIMRWLVGDNAFARRWPNLRRRQQTLHDFLLSVGAHMRLLAGIGSTNLLALAGLTAVQWLARYGTLWAVLSLLGHKVSFALTLLLQSLVLHAAMWTGVPGGGGSAELGLSATLAPWVSMSG
ncbi:MAG: flippase-like domain-containing protein, partial [Gammaproteobacteria bacterium]